MDKETIVAVLSIVGWLLVALVGIFGFVVLGVALIEIGAIEWRYRRYMRRLDAATARNDKAAMVQVAFDYITAEKVAEARRKKRWGVK